MTCRLPPIRCNACGFVERPNLNWLGALSSRMTKQTTFWVAVRWKIGLVRLSADERNDRDLRLVYGSALDRLLADGALR